MGGWCRGVRKIAQQGITSPLPQLVQTRVPEMGEKEIKRGGVCQEGGDQERRVGVWSERNERPEMREGARAKNRMENQGHRRARGV